MGCAKSKDGMVVETDSKFNVQISNKPKPEENAKKPAESTNISTSKPNTDQKPQDPKLTSSSPPKPSPTEPTPVQQAPTQTQQTPFVEKKENTSQPTEIKPSLPPVKNAARNDSQSPLQPLAQKQTNAVQSPALTSQPSQKIIADRAPMEPKPTPVSNTTAEAPSNLVLQQSNSSNDKPKPKLTDEKLPSLVPQKEKVIIEVDLGKKMDRPTTSSVRTRLEQSARLQGTSMQSLQRKQAAAAERRLQQQGMKIHKARADTQLVDERRQKVKEEEDKKAEQLRRIMIEKKKAAEAHKLAQEQEAKKKAELEAKHAQEVINKAKLLKTQSQSQEEEENKENTSTPNGNAQNFPIAVR